MPATNDANATSRFPDRDQDVRAGAPRAEPSRQVEATRPDGPLVWIHIDSETEAQGIPDLVDRLREERDNIAVLITEARPRSDSPGTRRLPSDVIVEKAPAGGARDCENFLSRWRPDVAVWAHNRLDPNLIKAVDRAGIELLLINARVPDRQGWRWLPGVRRSLLKRFSYVLAGDARAAAGLTSLGVAPGKVEAVGFLQETAAPLPFSQAERDSIAELLSARPVWFAAGITAGEVPMVVEAHRQAIRRAHRLLLVLGPADEDDGPAVANWLEADGWIGGLRSRDDEPEPDTEIFVADDPEEFGLWYRLAPISLMGGTLLGEARARNPFEAAALGSAVLYGPHPGSWRESYDRLRNAGAARAVSDISSLARAVESLLAPDKAAEMARAAWEVTTSGAEATDRAVELVLGALDERSG